MAGSRDAVIASIVIRSAITMMAYGERLRRTRIDLSALAVRLEPALVAVLLGTQEKPTPLGVFPILMKRAEHYSSTYDNAPMPYTMRLTEDGVAIHGTSVELGYASHGCIGVPNDFGKKLFGVTKLGDVVYITRGKRIGKGATLVKEKEATVEAAAK